MILLQRYEVAEVRGEGYTTKATGEVIPVVFATEGFRERFVRMEPHVLARLDGEGTIACTKVWLCLGYGRDGRPHDESIYVANSMETLQACLSTGSLRTLEDTTTGSD